MRKFFTIVFILSISLMLKSQVLINDIYGAGGNTGATWTHDVIQLINIGGTSVDLSSYGIQYASESGSSWNVDLFPSGTMIGAGEILNVMLSSGVNGLTPPTPSVQALAGVGGLIIMGTRAGKVALTNNTTALTGTGCPTSAVDYVGYGNTGSQTCGPHTTATIPASTNNQSYKRSNTSIPGNFNINLTPLPVDYYYLEISIINKFSYLNFTTASETNNSHFNIERSADARNFESIGEIKGAGNSSKEISYAFTDERPLPGINYYRIKQTDYDGQYSYSEIRSVRHKGISNVSITPRTTDGRVDIITELEDYTIAIYNASGQEVKKMTGMSLDQSISLETLHAGVYFVKINSGSESETLRIVKI